MISIILPVFKEPASRRMAGRAARRSALSPQALRIRNPNGKRQTSATSLENRAMILSDFESCFDQPPRGFIDVLRGEKGSYGGHGRHNAAEYLLWFLDSAG